MGLAQPIDITFDFRSDTPTGKDPDTHSPTLRRYHQFLWSKPLPSGRSFDLDVTTPRTYLHHGSELGEFGLSSDAVIPTFKWTELVRDQIPEEETEAFNRIGYTIGGMMVFPGYRVGRKMTLNQHRGCHPLIKDRFDLTLECIRRHYLGEDSPLGATIARYSDFFGLFGDFTGYVGFFLLQDLVDEDALTVKFSMPFDNFVGSPVPASLDAYVNYRRRAVEFIEARNRRIAACAVSGATQRPIPEAPAAGDPHFTERELLAEFESAGSSSLARRAGSLIDLARDANARFYPERRSGRPSVSVWLGDVGAGRLASFSLASGRRGLRVSFNFQWMAGYSKPEELRALAEQLARLPGLAGLEPASARQLRGRPSFAAAEVLPNDEAVEPLFEVLERYARPPRSVGI